MSDTMSNGATGVALNWYLFASHTTPSVLGGSG